MRANEKCGGRGPARRSNWSAASGFLRRCRARELQQPPMSIDHAARWPKGNGGGTISFSDMRKNISSESSLGNMHHETERNGHGRRVRPQSLEETSRQN